MENETSESADEGTKALGIEEHLAKIPTETLLWLAGGSIAASLALKFVGKDHAALFVGHWAPTFLLLGIHNKLNKLAESK